MERILVGGCKVKVNISGKCKIKLFRMVIVLFKMFKERLLKYYFYIGRFLIRID